MIAAFFDESGNDGISTVFAMAGVMASQLAWFHFENDWQRELARHDVAQFHASDFHGGRGEFRRWRQEQKAELHAALVDLFLKYEIKHTGIAVPKEEYGKSFDETGFYKKLVPAVAKWRKSPYYLCFQYLVQRLIEYAPHQDPGTFITPVFDRCQEYTKHTEAEIFPALNKKKILGRLFISSLSEYVQLQAADLLVWEYRINIERAIANPDAHFTTAMARVMPHMFVSQVWRFENMEELRRRVELSIEGIDPDIGQPLTTRK